MLRALWFFAQLAIVVCAAIWISTQQGHVDMAWGDYTISLQLGLFLLFLVLFSLVAIAFFRIVGAVVNLPSGMSRRRRERNRRKGFQALTRGFVAIAAGDIKKATTLAREVRHLLPDEKGLPLLLEAQAARLRGEEGIARRAFEQLLTDKDAAFFGVRGLLKSALDEGSYEKALSFARQALADNPKQPWIVKSVYDLEILCHHWDEAPKMLERARKLKAIEPDQARQDEIALMMIVAQRDRDGGRIKDWRHMLERVLKRDPAFVPAAVDLIAQDLEEGRRSKAVSRLEKTWKLAPHPDLVPLWDRATPDGRREDPMRRMRWFEKLVGLRADSVHGQLAAARVAMESGLNGEARGYLNAAEALRPSASVYRLRAQVEEAAGSPSVIVREWLDKAAHAPADPVWHCTRTGIMYDRWHPVAAPHGAFNSIVYGIPGAQEDFAHAPARAVMHGWQDPLLIEKN